MSAKTMWLSAPGEHMSDNIKKIIQEKWNDEPTAIQLLDVIDHCAYYGEASDFVVAALDVMLQLAMKQEGIEFEELIKNATWRENNA